MGVIDVVIKLNNKGEILGAEWFNEDMRKLFESIWDRKTGERLSDTFIGFSADSTEGSMIWEDVRFEYSLLNDGDKLLVLARQKKDDDYLLKAALNHVDEGVHIYNKEAQVVFINNVSREISGIPDDVPLEGRHLLDIYPLDENVSTVLTSLRTKQPVYNRVDHYYTSDGTFIAGAYTAYPIKRDGSIIGSVVFEQNKEVVANHINRMNRVENALDAYNDTEPRMAFTGYTFDNILGNGAALKESVYIARKAASQDCSILLVGETGTGKELFAQAIHNESGRRSGKFFAINCAAVPENLIEGILFGTVKGSFTGSEDRAGYLEEASGGTVFLDEINSMSLGMQSKILRAVQEQRIRRVGGTKTIDIDVRFISSCNEDPFKAISENRLRRDLFYRLSTVMVSLPPLRSHMEDLPLLVDYRIRTSNMRFVNKVEKISPDVLEFLNSYSWPGNVRELFHVVDYAMNIMETDTMEMQHLPKHLFKNDADETRDYGEDSKSGKYGISVYEPDWSQETLQSVMDKYENGIIRQALDQYGGNISRTAEALDIKRQSLQYRIHKYGIII